MGGTRGGVGRAAGEGTAGGTEGAAASAAAVPGRAGGRCRPGPGGPASPPAPASPGEQTTAALAGGFPQGMRVGEGGSCDLRRFEVEDPAADAGGVLRERPRGREASITGA